MPKDTKNKKHIGAILCAVVVIGVLLVYLAVFLFPVLGAEVGDGFAVAVLVMGMLGVLSVIGGVLAALAQRLKEIKGGEEEDAKKY